MGLLILCHTAQWIPKKIREIEGVKYIIGGHPGITQKYRGVHSPFWAILKGDYSSIGWTTFFIDSGVDSGDILDQGFLSLSDTQSYFSISWLGMKEIALSHVRSVHEFAKTGHLKANKNRFLNPSSLYDLPGISEQIRYWLVQRRFRRRYAERSHSLS